jgi:hypothetical protein
MSTQDLALSRLRVRIRWWVVFSLSMILTDMLAPIWSIFKHPHSWAARITEVDMLPGMLVGWMALAAALMLPHLVCAVLAPYAHWRRTSMGMAATGLGMGAFGFGVMAFIVTRFDAPQAATQWTVSAIWCVVGMLMLAGAVNSEQNVRRACAQGVPCA